MNIVIEPTQGDRAPTEKRERKSHAEAGPLHEPIVPIPAASPQTGRLHRRVEFPYYLVAPDYRETSSGIQCLHYLCHALNLEGADAYVVGCTTVHPRLKTPRLTDDIRDQHIADGRPPIAVYPETIRGNPLGADVCVRYMLNREGVIGGNTMDAAPGDIFVYHRAEFVDPARPGEVLTLPMVDPDTFSPEPAEERTLTLLYLNRVPKSAIDFQTLPADVQVLSPDVPLPLDALAPLFRRARVLYTFESSTTCRLAAMCGCPVVALTAPGYDRYACTPQTRADVGGGIVWDDSPRSLAKAHAETPAVRCQHLQAEDRFWTRLQAFTSTTQEVMRKKASGENTPKVAPSMQLWLERRMPTAAQSAIVAQALQTATCPMLGVIVVGQAHSPDAAAATLASLQRAHGLYPYLRLDWLGKPPPMHTAVGSATALQIHFHAEGSYPDVNRIVQNGDCDWVIVVDAGSEFIAPGMLAAALELIATPHTRALCADEMMRGGTGELSALLRPDFNLDLLLSMPSGLSRHWLFRRDAFLDTGGFDPAFADAPEFDLLLRLIDAGGIEGLGHVHEPLLILPLQEVRTRDSELELLHRHLRNRGYDRASIEAHLPGCYRIDYGHQPTPGVSIIIPSRNQFGLLNRCIESLLEKTRYANYEVLIVDNGSTDSDACSWLDGITAMDTPQLRVMRYAQPFDYAAMVNLAAQSARGEYLLLLDNDTAILRDDWLDAMLNHAQRPEVGIVGAKLLNPDGTVQHAGSVLGLHGPAAPAFAGGKIDAPGYMYRLQVDQNYSAVSGSCLMIRRSVFDEIGGLDGGPLRNAYNDADLCLKAGQAGYLIVWTPHALLLHEGGASQVREDRTNIETKARLRIEAQDAMYVKWLPVLANDPAYNRNLSLNGPAFQVETDTTFNWNPLPWRPLPVALALPADRFGCGHYRILQPATAMNAFGIADVRVGDRYCTPVEMERLAPDVVVLQRQMLKSQLEPQKRMLRFSRSFKVAELDDYLPNVPMKSAHKGQLPSDVLKTMRDALKLVDRFVVSTAPLAEALDGLHPDIRIIENRLPLPWWGAVKAQRRQGRRPRVGWGGGAGHRGDLELIADVVRELADEVEWVFLGMCPDKLRPYVHEFYPGVAIEDYPARLAGLNLDLALAPLEDNLFNRCKSNLRLLEYGACGYPIVCSDVTPYRGELPVTRVKPRFRDWVEAVRMHTHDLDAAARAGDALRDAVRRDWMLDESHATFWLSQWLPD
ncbi:glycosyltransferase [Luteimonas chenhongjianii]|nr:glycosyltransferase [Luteimonas chenhongjianii]